MLSQPRLLRETKPGSHIHTYIHTHIKRFFKLLVHAIEGAGKFEICRVLQQAGNSGTSNAVGLRQNLFFWGGILIFAFNAFH